MRPPFMSRRSAAVSKPEPPPRADSSTKQELLEMAAELGVKVSERMTKSEIEAAILSAD